MKNRKKQGIEKETVLGAPEGLEEGTSCKQPVLGSCWKSVLGRGRRTAKAQDEKAQRTPAGSGDGLRGEVVRPGQSAGWRLRGAHKGGCWGM